ncbi:hypothetical protein EC968_008366 [Mortierella alpina]|nr:hypothetical protein EC968_008366 [Mortierella alpina]
MTWIIFARGVAGIGAGGVLSMVMIIIADLVSLRNRGKYQGAITIIVVMLLLHLPQTESSFEDKVKRIDFLGSLSLICGLVLVLLPLNWGGNAYAWNSLIVISLFCVGFLVLVAFSLIEWKLAAEPIIPFHLLKNRTTSAVFLTSFFIGMGYYGIMYFMPLYFQIVRQECATSAGLEMLPMLVSMVIASIGSGLMTQEVCYLVAAGFGLGLVMQTIVLAVQSSVDAKDVAVATAITTFFRTIGSAFGVAITGAVFNNAVQVNLAPLIKSNPDVANVLQNTYLAPAFGPELEFLILRAAGFLVQFIHSKSQAPKGACPTTLTIECPQFLIRPSQLFSQI